MSESTDQTAKRGAELEADGDLGAIRDLPEPQVTPERGDGVRGGATATGTSLPPDQRRQIARDM